MSVTKEKEIIGPAKFGAFNIHRERHTGAAGCVLTLSIMLVFSSVKIRAGPKLMRKVRGWKERRGHLFTDKSLTFPFPA